MGKSRTTCLSNGLYFLCSFCILNFHILSLVWTLSKKIFNYFVYLVSIHLYLTHLATLSIILFALAIHNSINCCCISLFCFVNLCFSFFSSLFHCILQLMSVHVCQHVDSSAKMRRNQKKRKKSVKNKKNERVQQH